MRCRPWRWLWGLLPLALVVFLTTIGERQRIERDLTVRTEQTLQAEGLGWARLQFEGRDGVLVGTAPSQADRVLAYDIAQAVHGVRVVRNESVVQTAVVPYTWRVEKDNNRIVLSGHMPDDASRSEALRLARERYPEATVVDEMSVALGAPAGDLWSRGTQFALRQLGFVQTGVITLTDTTFDMVGRVVSPAAYGQLRERLASRLPRGWTLGKHQIDPPVVDTYSWTFDRLEGDVVLNGYVPDARTRKRLVKAARSQYPDARITDRMQVAGGAPDGFAAFALSAIAESAPLDEVRVSLLGRDITVTGLAADQFLSGTVANKLGGAAKGLSVANKLRVKRRLPQRADPYVWSARRDGTTIVLSGHVPDDAARASVLRDIEDLYPGVPVNDQMTLASGAPKGRSVWLAIVRRSLSAMANFDKGFASLNGTALRVGGETQDADRLSRGNDVLDSGSFDGFAVTRAFELLELEVDPGIEAERLRKLAEQKAEDERIRLANLAAAEEAERVRAADLAAERKAERLRKLAEQKAEDERIRLANLAAAEEAKRLRAAELAAEKEAERLRKLAEQRAEDERIRLANVAAAQEAERVRAADLSAEREAERLRKLAEQRAEAERIRLANVAAAEEAARVRAADLAAEREAARRRNLAEQEAEDERIRLANLAAAEEAARAEQAAREARRSEYRLIAEYNGTPVELWRARRAAKDAGKNENTVDVTTFEERSKDSNGRLVLRGKVASSRMRVELRGVARSKFDGGVVDRLEVIDGAEDAEWQAAAAQSLNELSRLRNGAVVVEQGTVEFFGDAVSLDAARAVRSSIAKEAPVRFKVSSLVTAPKVLKKKAIETQIQKGGEVNAEACGVLMNSVANLEPIRFQSESAEIRASAFETLNTLVRVAEKCPQARVRVAGHTDSRGPEAYNQKLSEERAEAVLKYLGDKGIARDRMRARGFGESQPLVSNETRELRKKNRRIEFTVTEN